MSESAKHTPGPWRVVESGTNRSIHPEQADGLAIAQMAWQRDSIADALLIAAAPDMLDALRKVAHGFAPYGRMPKREALRVVRVAIEKATGHDS